MTTAKAAQESTRNRERLQQRLGELDRALVEHARKAQEQQSEWRTTEADLLRERNITLRQLSEL
jgi:hypothetical protein